MKEREGIGRKGTNEALELQGRNDGGRAGSALLKGAALLGLAAVISKLIGTLQKIPLQNLAGDAVFGIYNAVYPLYILILFLATAGFPLVISKFVSEYAADRRYDEARRVLRVALVALMGTGICSFLLLFFGADRIGGWIGASQTAAAIRSVSFALLIVPVMSCLRGYYQGFQNMVPTAWSQVVEQAVRVGTMLILLIVLMRLGYGPEWIAAGATFGSVTGAMAGLAVMLFFWRRDLGRPGDSSSTAISVWEWKRDLALMKRLTVYAIPLCLGTVAVPILTLVDSFTLPRLLRISGYDETGALYQFGLYNHGVPLVQLVAMIASSMSAVLVPAMAEARQRGDMKAVSSRAEMSLRYTWLIGLAAAVGLALLARPLNVMFFKSAEGTAAMAILSFTALFSVVNIVAGSVLQGLGAVRAPALYLLLAAGVKVAANLLLVPRYGITGAAAAAVAAYALAGGLALAHALRAAGVTAPSSRAVMKPMLAIGFMTLSLLAVTHGAPPLLALLPVAQSGRGMAAVIALCGVAVGASAYALALLRMGAVTAAELAQLPKLRGKPLALLRRLRLLR